MKITKIDILGTEVPFKTGSVQENLGEIFLGKWKTCRFVIVKVYTDAGIVGYGESAPWVKTSQLGQKPIMDELSDYLAPAIIGMDPFNIEAIWKKMDSTSPNHPQAKGILDMAMYDIMGKAVGMPAYNFFGGAVRKEIPLSSIITIDTPDNMRKSALDSIEDGFRTVRIKLGLGTPEKDMELVRQIRNDIGPDIKLRVDPNQAYSVKEALRMIPCLEENNVEIFEQPVSWDNIDGLAEINTKTWIPVMPHESMHSIYDVRELMDKKAVSLFTIKMDRPGGITKARITRDIAELYNIPCVVMSSIELSTATFASMQFAATIKNLPFACEASGVYEIEDIADGAASIVNGNFVLNDEPGFGVNINEERLQRFTKSIRTVDENSTVQD